MKKWSRQNEMDLKRVIETAEGMGLKHATLARAAGVSSTHFHLWQKRKTRMTVEQVQAMDKLLQLPPGAKTNGLTGSAQDIAVLRVVEELGRLAGEVPKDEPDVMRYLARKNVASIFGQALRLMIGAKSELARARMVEFLAERGFGRAVQAFEDRTPKAPVEDAEFMDLIGRLLNGEDPTPPKAPVKVKKSAAKKADADA